MNVYLQFVVSKLSILHIVANVNDAKLSVWRRKCIIRENLLVANFAKMTEVY